MNFVHKGRPLSDAGLANVCAQLGVAEAEAWAVLAVETHGFGFFADRRPQILFERHVFHRLTGGRHDAAHPGISNKNSGGYIGGPAEYGRLDEAVRLDENAALQSASWGIGQVMGFNFSSAGFRDVESLVQAMVDGEDRQLLAMAGFIQDKGLDRALQSQDWAGFALGYNGADFRRNSYDTRLAAAHAKYKVQLPDLALRTAQAALLYLGFNPGSIDGVNGRRTRAALSDFQDKSGLPVTGGLDAASETVLLGAAGF